MENTDTIIPTGEEGGRTIMYHKVLVREVNREMPICPSRESYSGRK